MVSKFSFFFTTLQFTPSHFFPHRRQQLMDLLEEIAEDLPTNPCCEDLLEIWLESFGVSGLILGNLALFGIGFLLMMSVDLRLWRWSGSLFQTAIPIVNGLYCLLKFKTHLPSTCLLILLFVIFWMLCGFWWSIGFLFLVYFTNMGAIYARGGRLC